MADNIVKMPGSEPVPGDAPQEPMGLPPGVSIYSCEKEGCDSKIFANGAMMVKISKIAPSNNSGQDQLIPQPGFYCVKCHTFVAISMKNQ